MSYSIDREDRLQMVDEGWLEFAFANDAPELTPAAVLGRPIEAFIAGHTTRYLYRLVYEQVRRGATFRLAFRCDAPEVRRNMVLQLSSGGSGVIQFDTFLLGKRPHSPIALLDAELPRGPGHLVMCSWCKGIRHQGRWLDLEEAMRELQLFSSPLIPEISHGVCEDCAEGLYSAAEQPAGPSTPLPKGADSMRVGATTDAIESR